MDEKSVKKALETLRKNNQKRKFSQTVDLIVTLKDIDMNKTAKIEEFIRLPSGRGKNSKICAIIGDESADGAKSADKIILNSEFKKWNDKKQIKKLTREFDFFIAQADMMPQIAQIFGKYFGPLNKMPNPKAGAIVPPKANLTPIIEKLRSTVRITATKSPVFQCAVGTEELNDVDLTKNTLAVLDSIEHAVPNGRNNIGKKR